MKIERAQRPAGPWKQIGKRVLSVVGEGHPLFPKNAGAQEAAGGFFGMGAVYHA